ncbi:hypothetical protein [Agriterribacter sp.]|uniref:hypothetical protein n=1 Tax=Agriterribacter sp. TaxID=2821509 RepID=UPI002C2D3ED0|nr:hypothetical protein [Agriterribacter sp.]HTN05184.1 hypothetical protein [Agriterribacter sp.]
MLKALEHKRFTIPMWNTQLSLAVRYWYVQANNSIVPAGNEEDSKHKRPWYNYT